ncbi:MAG: NUDIX hydrolase [Candidatus Zixiibacteriota bacterium]
MFVSAASIKGWEGRYGTPVEWTDVQSISDEDHQVISHSQRHGRRHDITLYIEGDGKIAVIAKPFYPPGLYRAPSGGLDPDEDLETGAAREGLEETGLTVRLERYLLRAHVAFTSRLGDIAWHTHVFSASTPDRLIAPTDHHEIREARWADPGEFRDFDLIMRRSERGGLQYRARLHEQVARLHHLFRHGR